MRPGTDAGLAANRAAKAFGLDTANGGEVDNQPMVLVGGCWSDVRPNRGRAELPLAVEDLDEALCGRAVQVATRMTVTPLTGASTTSATA